MTKILFLDTNVYLHYQDFDRINWPDLVREEEVTIVLCPVISRELNKHKDTHPRQRIKKRAGTILNKLAMLFTERSQVQLRAHIEMQFDDRDPLMDFEEYQLSREVQDDQFIANIIMYRQEHPDADVVLVTSDAGLTLVAKARRLGIATMKPPDNFKLPEEPDPDQEKIRKLEEENRALKSAIPQLSLVFRGGSNHSKFTPNRPTELLQEDIDKRVEEIKKQNPRMDQPPKQVEEPLLKRSGYSEAIRAALRQDSLNSVPPESIAKYNADLDEFYRAYVCYLKDDAQFKNFRRLTIELAIYLVNSGTAPAEDIDVNLLFPDGFSVRSGKEFPKPPQCPKPPSHPKTRLDMIVGPPSALSDSLLGVRAELASRSSTDVRPSNVSSPVIKRTNSYDVGIHVQRLKHQRQEPFQLLCLTFDSFDRASPFQIDYEILAANMPHTTRGKLHINIEKEN